MDEQGNASVIWARSMSVFASSPVGVIQAAARPAAGGSARDGWSVPQDVSSARQYVNSPSLTLDGKGNATAVWISGLSSAGGNIQSATRPAGSAWSAPQNLSPVQNIGQAPRVAVNPRGDAVVTWVRFEGENVTPNNEKYFVLAANRTAGGPWSTPQDIAPNAASSGASVAVDEQGNAFALWGGQAGSIVNAAGFDAAGPQLRDLVVPEAGTVGTPAAFSVAPLDVWSQVTSTRWDFGDATGAEGKSVAHSYAAPGSYAVTVTSTDSLGNVSSEKRTVVIVNAPVTPSPEVPPPGASTTPDSGTTAAPSSSPGAAVTTATTLGTGGPQLGALPPISPATTTKERSALSRCLALANRLKTTTAKRKGRAACARPGRVGGLKARRSSRTVKLSFLAPGSVGRFGPAARRYVVKQSFKPITCCPMSQTQLSEEPWSSAW